MRDVILELNHLKKLATHDPTKRFDRLYRLVCQRQLLALARERIAGNAGAHTPGVDGRTIDDANEEVIQHLSADLQQGQYHPRPVRRVYIPKRNGKLRPLGIPMPGSYCISCY
jgi:RNA-directed DNA polymerase